MAGLITRVRRWRPSWHTALVGAGTVLLALSFALFDAALAPMTVTTVGAVLGGAGVALGVSASCAALLERDAYADSDFYR